MSSLDAKARIAKAEYQREYMRGWRKKNPEKVKESQKRYWAKRFEENNQSNGVDDNGTNNNQAD